MFSFKRLYLRTIGKMVPTDLFAPRFPVSVKGVCLIDDRVILVRNERGKWDLPGGKLSSGESVRDCLVREMKEELGIEVVPHALLDMLLVRVRGMVTVVVPVYHCETSASCAEITLSEEHFEVSCVPVGKLKDLDLAADYERLILHAGRMVRETM